MKDYRQEQRERNIRMFTLTKEQQVEHTKRVNKERQFNLRQVSGRDITHRELMSKLGMSQTEFE